MKGWSCKWNKKMSWQLCTTLFFSLNPPKPKAGLCCLAFSVCLCSFTICSAFAGWGISFSKPAHSLLCFSDLLLLSTVTNGITLRPESGEISTSLNRPSLVIAENRSSLVLMSSVHKMRLPTDFILQTPLIGTMFHLLCESKKPFLFFS